MNRNLRRASLSKKLSAVLATLAMLFGLSLTTTTLATPASADASHEALIGMPFAGKWAYNATVSPPYTDSNSSHPSVHHTPGSGDWATDLYAAEGTPVKLEVTAATGSLSYSWASSTTSCGQSTRLNVFVDGVNVGWLYFAHLNNAVTGGSITNGMTLGYVKNWGGCNPGTHVHVEFRNASSYSCYYDNGNPGISLGDGAGLGVLGSTKSSAHQACSSTDLPSSGSSSMPPANSSDTNLLLARQGGNLFGKAGLGDAWTALASNATGGMWASGNRIAYLSSGTLYAKNGLSGAWMNESSNVDEVALSNDLLVIRKGTTIYAKGALDSAWVTIATDAIDVKVAGTKILHRNAAHTLYSNDGMYGSWYAEGNNVDQFDASGNLLVKRVGNYAYAKTSLGASWTEVSNVASNVQVGGTRIAVTSTQDNHVWVKDGVSGTWINEESAGDEYIVTPNTLLIRQGNTVIAKSGLADAWVTLATTSTNVEASGSRIAVVNSSGDLAARNDLPTGWYNVLDSVTEFTVGS